MIVGCHYYRGDCEERIGCYLFQYTYCMFLLQDSEIEESSNLNAPATPSMSDVDDGEEVVSSNCLL